MNFHVPFYRMIKIAYNGSLFWETAKVIITKIKQKPLIWCYNIQVENRSPWWYSLSWLKEKVYCCERFFFNATSFIMPVVPANTPFSLEPWIRTCNLYFNSCPGLWAEKMAAIQNKEKSAKTCLRVRQEDYKSNNCIPTFLSTKLLCFLEKFKYKFYSNK